MFSADFSVYSSANNLFKSQAGREKNHQSIRSEYGSAEGQSSTCNDEAGGSLKISSSLTTLSSTGRSCENRPGLSWSEYDEERRLSCKHLQGRRW